MKQDLYRLPNSTLNNLALYFNLKSVSSWKRIDELCSKGKLKKKAAKHLKEAITEISRLRLTTHLYYRCEKESIHYDDVSFSEEKGTFATLNIFCFSEDNIKMLADIYRVTLPLHHYMALFVDSHGKDKSFKKVDFYEDALVAKA